MSLKIPQGTAIIINYLKWMQGIWSGMIGGTVIQTIILLWVTFRTDWNKEVLSTLIFYITNKKYGEHV